MNWSLKRPKTFRLASYTPQKFHETLKHNLEALEETLHWNAEHGFFFFRIYSQLVPFASHEVCQENWQEEYKEDFARIGAFIKEHDMRISFHPDQFVLINSPDERILNNSIKELEYHADILELLGLGAEAKIQIHVGGVYGDKEKAIYRFIERHEQLPDRIKKHLVIENDDRLFSLHDCLCIHEATKIPIIFDTLHHACLNNDETQAEGLRLAAQTWTDKDGILMVDYSTQEPEARKGNHAQKIDINDFKNFLKEAPECDIMLEIKDKEKSALQARDVMR